MKDVRWLITGERDWRDLDAIAELIGSVQEDVDRYPDHRLVVVHGDCPTGADRLTQVVCESLGVATERFPVDHSLDGPWPAAGPRRNSRMCHSGPFAGWLAFWSGKRERSGTLDCMSQITALGVNGQVVARRAKKDPGGKQEGEGSDG